MNTRLPQTRSLFLVSLWSAIAAMLVFSAGVAFAGTAATWSNAAGTNFWSNANNWNPGVQPNGDFDVTIGAPSPTNLDINVSIATLNVQAAGLLNMIDGRVLTMTQTSLANAGTIVINSNGGLGTSRLQLSQDVTLSGAGTIILNSNDGAEIAGAVSLTQTASHTISGRGILNVSMQNSGLVTANQSGGTLSVVKSQANFGTFKATNGGTLAINSGGAIQGGQVVADGGNVGLNSGSLVNATLSTANAGLFFTNAGTTSSVDSVTNTGNFLIQSNTTLQITGLSNAKLTNNGTITIDGAAGAPAALRAINDRTINGTGTIVMSTANSQITSNSAQLTQAAGHTIRGQGSIATALDNSGTVRADINGATLFANTNALVNNSGGLVEALNGGTLNASDLRNAVGATINVGNNSTVTAPLSFANQGVIRLGSNGGTGTFTSSTGLSQLNTGSLLGNGTLNANVSNDGVIAPGLSAGQLNINGNLSLTSNSRVQFEIGGTVSGTQHDFLFVSGSVGLGGQLAVTLISGFVPSNSDTFVIVDGSLMSGAFSNVASGQRLTTTDGVSSFLVTTGGISSTVTLSNFIIPEPSTYILLLIGSGGLLAVRRRKLSPSATNPRTVPVTSSPPRSAHFAMLVALFAIGHSPLVFAQGSLTPPSPPAPSMKTLGQLEPRTPIGATTTPGDADSFYKITQPGSYYLTGNITGVSGKSGIRSLPTA